ncbi:MAG: murein biosynthesis integral membrane protein MurJ [Chloroflexota bacterium]|nr:murein biosynthesis integral membrane protein MurJ [Chloroflexota bacterium]
MEEPVTQEFVAPVATSMGRVLSFATITAAGFILGQASGLVREIVVSAQFGLSAEFDAYKLAVLVPTIINNIVAGSAISAAVMPTFARYLSAGQRAEFWRVASIITNFVLVGTGALTALGMLLAAPIISVFGIGLPPSTQTLAATLLLIMMPTLALGALLNLLMAALNSLDRFVGRALILIALNGGMIVTVFLLAPRIGIYSVAVGFLIGVILQVLAQAFELKREHAQYTFALDLHHPALREVGIAFLPITALAIVSQINIAIDTSMASGLPTGSIGALSYANTILGAFYALGISLGIAVFPSLSRMAAVNDLQSTARAVTLSLRMLIFVLAPLTLLLMAFAHPVVSLLLQRGRFDAAAVDMTASALAMYAIGLIAIAALNILQPAFYALSQSRTPLIVGSIVVILHVGLNLLLIPSMAHAGIALSASITTLAGVVVLIALFARRVPGVALDGLLTFLFRCAMLAVVSTLPVAWLYAALRAGTATMGAWIMAVGFAAAGGALYFGLALVTRTRESTLLLQTARGFLKLDGGRKTEDGGS